MKRNLKNILVALLLVVSALVLTVLIYLAYVIFSYSRIPDRTELEVENQSQRILEKNTEYSAVTYNVGFGAYSDEFSFFMDEAEWEDGSHTQGKYGKGISREDVIANVEGQAAILRDILPDFILLQEVDEDSTRSYHIDMVQYFKDTFPYMNSTYAINYHSAWLNLPLLDPIGIINSGCVTLSRFFVQYAERRSYPLATDLSKFFDLDRCFTVERFPVDGGKTLVLVNSHMSAYDEGGVIRKAQLDMLTSFMAEEYEKGNWVIVGGDFNHSLGQEFREAFPSEQVIPEWAKVLDDEDLPDHFALVKPENGMETPSCRNADTPYEEGKNYSTVLDGFIVSDNVLATATVYDTGFLYSDHNPVILNFTLK